MKIVITGSTGMIGLALISLFHEKHEIYAIVRPSSSKRNLLKEFNNINIIECDLNNLKSLKSIIKKTDLFFHLGWIGTTGNERDDSILQLKNVKYTLDAIQLSEDLQCTSFVGAGSQAEYGIQNKKLNEKTHPNPTTSYGIAKYCAGKLGKNLTKNLKVKFCWTRILSVYGFGETHTLIGSLISSILENRTFNTTHANQTWNYIYSKDCANALYQIAVYGKDGETYLIAGDEERLLKDYITSVRDLINSNYVIGFGKRDYNTNQVMYLTGDISKLKKDTNFKINYSFEEGIKETIEWHKKNLNNK